MQYSKEQAFVAAQQQLEESNLVRGYLHDLQCYYHRQLQAELDTEASQAKVTSI